MAPEHAHYNGSKKIRSLREDKLASGAKARSRYGEACFQRGRVIKEARGQHTALRAGKDYETNLRRKREFRVPLELEPGRLRVQETTPSLDSAGTDDQDSENAESDGDLPIEVICDLEVIPQDVDEQELQRLRRENDRSSSPAGANEGIDDEEAGEEKVSFPSPQHSKHSHGPTGSEQEHFQRVSCVRHSYMQKLKLPQPLLAEELLERTLKYFPLVEKILSGQHPSMYYDHARSAFKRSRRAVLSIDEFRRLDLSLFTAGYYGVRRQMRVAVEVLHHYRDLIARQNNRVLRWWGVSDFAQYVLAPELLSALCQEEMNLPTLEDAWDVMEATTEFGLLVADDGPLEEWEVPAHLARLEAAGHSSNLREDPSNDKR
ncbi:Rtc4p [Lachancea thermotolerans CBS 6340]|uniref:Restriction of telomere capping protein 4 n=1 Tax=Lachancea thermotolerans (strain ATCC 56472 / CBS 6340 / NRRL Y-8284) TaxID=559295 RepID=RTC4_LACTC|nr:KLTH0F02926p [Lachancea thermotolerans CBS 6340]C5DKA0.1 RecName: Full=Restriction of telomere capping protein 4 [Lachancea thermotolerans CBS 6340]CAR23901.1 KLTH0F02926p [Lachancea thermotolerans CBS 6340]